MNVIFKKKTTFDVIDLQAYTITSVELSSGTYTVVCSLSPDEPYTFTYSETDYLMYIVPKVEE